MKNPKERFTDRVSDYAKYRPGYPEELLNYLITNCNLNGNSIIADIGYGTGIFTKLLLAKGFKVYGIEPNEAMRKQGEYNLKKYNNFISIDGSAENTTINSETIDLITACQSFHWFEKDKCKNEFKRIIKKDGFIALIWNTLLTDTPFLIEYNGLIKAIPEYDKDKNKDREENDIEVFYSPNNYKLVRFKNKQQFDLAGLKGRLASCSYAPREGEEYYIEANEKLEEIFHKHNKDGIIDFNYETQLYIGKL